MGLVLPPLDISLKCSIHNLFIHLIKFVTWFLFTLYTSHVFCDLKVSLSFIACWTSLTIHTDKIWDFKNLVFLFVTCDTRNWYKSLNLSTIGSTLSSQRMRFQETLEKVLLCLKDSILNNHYMPLWFVQYVFKFCNFLLANIKKWSLNDQSTTWRIKI